MQKLIIAYILFIKQKNLYTKIDYRLLKQTLNNHTFCLNL